MRWTVRKPLNEHISENNDRPPAGKWKHIQTRSSNNNAPCNQWPNGFVQKVCCGLFCYRMEMHIVWKHGLHEEAYRSAPMRFEYRASWPEDTVKQIKFMFFAFFFSRSACATLVHLTLPSLPPCPGYYLPPKHPPIPTLPPSLGLGKSFKRKRGEWGSLTHHTFYRRFR